MFKKSYLLALTIIIILGLIYIVFNKNNYDKNNIFFSYPTEDLEFAGKKIPGFKDNYLVKEKFDKEFLNTSYNLYQFFMYVKRLPVYLPYIEQKLKENNIPDDFKYLPIAESALKNDVTSDAGASGIWQFMPETAKQYGLIINDYVDERYNFEKSTDAAIKYIAYLHTIFDDWALVTASYNRGYNAIQKALKDQNVDNYYDLYLNEETSRYVFKIISIKYVIKDYLSKKNYIDKIIGGVYVIPKTKIIKVGKIEDLKKWSQEKGYNYQSIKTLNTWILKDSLPDGDWEIKVLDK